MSAKFRVNEVDGFPLDDVVQFFVELVVVGVDRVEDFFRAVDELHGRRIVGLAQRVDFHPVLEHFHRGVWFAVDEEPAKGHPVHIAARMRDVVIASVLFVLGQFTLIAGRHDEILAAFAPIGTRQSHVDDEAEEGIINGARSGTGRDFDHGRPVLLQIEQAEAIDGLGVAGEEQRIGIQQFLENEHLVGFGGAPLDMAQAKPFEGCSWNKIEEGLDRAERVEVVVELLRGFGIGDAIGEVERSDAGLDLVGRHDFVRDLVIEARCVLREGGTAYQGDGGGGGYRGSGIHGLYPYLVVSSCVLEFAAEFASRIE